MHRLDVGRDQGAEPGGVGGAGPKDRRGQLGAGAGERSRGARPVERSSRKCTIRCTTVAMAMIVTIDESIELTIVNRQWL